MKERTKSNLITISILIFELVVFVALSYLIPLTFIWSNEAYWVYIFAIVVICLFGVVVWGITIGYLGYQKDVWKIAIGAMFVIPIIATLFLLYPYTSIWLLILEILLCTYGANTIIFLVSHYTMKHNLKKNGLEIEFEIIEEPQSDYVS